MRQAGWPIIQPARCEQNKKHLLSQMLFVRRLQFGYFALESLYRNGLQISGKKYSQFF